MRNRKGSAFLGLNPIKVFSLNRKPKKAAMELSVSTIVIVVLAMSMLILGIVLVKNIFEGATNIADMTNDQLKNQVSILFGGDKKLVVYPDTQQRDIKQGDHDGFGIGIKNLIEGSNNVKFSYEVIVSDTDIRKKCGVTEQEALDWIVTGRAEDNIELAPGEFTSGKVLFYIPEGTALCTLRYRVNVKVDGNSYQSKHFDITIKAA